MLCVYIGAACCSSGDAVGLCSFCWLNIWSLRSISARPLPPARHVTVVSINHSINSGCSSGSTPSDSATDRELRKLMYIVRQVRTSRHTTQTSLQSAIHRSLSIPISCRWPAHVHDSDPDRKHVTSTSGNSHAAGQSNDEASDVTGTTQNVDKRIESDVAWSRSANGAEIIWTTRSVIDCGDISPARLRPVSLLAVTRTATRGLCVSTDGEATKSSQMYSMCLLIKTIFTAYTSYALHAYARHVEIIMHFLLVLRNFSFTRRTRKPYWSKIIIIFM